LVVEVAEIIIQQAAGFQVVLVAAVQVVAHQVMLVDQAQLDKEMLEVVETLMLATMEQVAEVAQVQLAEQVLHLLAEMGA
jgi:hypothetical protein